MSNRLHLFSKNLEFSFVFEGTMLSSIYKYRNLNYISFSIEPYLALANIPSIEADFCFTASSKAMAKAMRISSCCALET